VVDNVDLTCLVSMSLLDGHDSKDRSMSLHKSIAGSVPIPVLGVPDVRQNYSSSQMAAGDLENTDPTCIIVCAAVFAPVFWFHQRGSKSNTWHP